MRDTWRVGATNLVTRHKIARQSATDDCYNNGEDAMSQEIAKKLYGKMPDAVAKARKKFGRGLTLTEKILVSHVDNWETQGWERGKAMLALRPDRVAMQDATAQMAMLQFMQAGKTKVAVPSTIHCDHLIRAESGSQKDLLRAIDENKEVYNFLASAAKKYGIGFWKPGAGIIHQVVLENYAFPGGLIIGTDSHTPNGGGLGMLAIGVGGADAGEVMAGLVWEVLHPKLIGVRLTGKLQGWTSSKDVILYICGLLTVKGGTNKILEYFGPGAATISCTGKGTITNMGAELGATTSVFPFDEKMAAYLRMTDRKEIAKLAEVSREMLVADSEVEKSPEKYFDQIVEIDLSKLEPHVVKGRVDSIISSYNRNFPGRNDGMNETMSFLTSPEIVTAVAFAGDLTFDPVHGALKTAAGKELKFEPPQGEELPAKGFARVEEGYVPPAEDGESLQVEIPPGSERLQLLRPFPRWDGKHFIKLPLLIKTKGKTTTDHISPAGPWLKYRGHLDKISDNMFLGAANAFYSEIGKGTDVLTGESGLTIAQIARRYKAQGIGSAVVGDENYGEGSSREHAAMSPRFLGVKVIITKSFARIHETNLKKQGILALTFADLKDYDQIEQTDRISVVNLQNLKPGRPVTVVVHKADGKEITIQTHQSLTAQQISWFKAGSALNALN